MNHIVFLTVSSLLMLGCASSDPPSDRPLGYTYELPEPGVGQGGPAYQTDDENDDVAKADALAIIEGFEQLYGLTDPPPEGTELLPEWVASDAVLVSWFEPFGDYFDALMLSLTPYTPVWVLTADEGESAALKQRWDEMGIRLDNVQFFEYTHEAFWTRDFGPWSVKLPNGTIGYVDAKYYPTRYLDDAVPTLLAEYHQLPVFRPRLSAEGGNVMTNGAGLCITTTRLAYNNPPKRSFEVHDMLRRWLGCEQTHFLEPLDNERTGHVDLFAKFTQPDIVVLGAYEADSDLENAIRMDRNAQRLARIRLSDGRPLKVIRIPMPPSDSPVFRTYTNALTINNTLVMPIYTDYPELNTAARAIFEEALPEDTVVETVEADSVIEVGGAVHCTTMQLSTLPTNWKRIEAHVPGPIAWPEGAIGNTANVKWSSGETITETMVGMPVAQTDEMGTVEIGVTIEHRAPETVVIRIHHDGQTVELPITNDATPINERRLVTDGFVGTSSDGNWLIEIESERFNFSGALLEWWVRRQ